MGKPLFVASRGDALTPYLTDALQRRFPGALGVGCDLTVAQRYGVAVSSFAHMVGRWRRGSGPVGVMAWREAFYKSHLAYRLRSQNADRALAAAGATGSTPVVQVHALFELSTCPAFIYVDCTHQQVMDHWSPWNPMSAQESAAWVERERRAYRAAAHVFAFSQVTARSLVEDYGVAQDRVTVVGAGMNVADRAIHEPVVRATDPERPTILFIGNDFPRKGGQVLLDAFEQVRRDLPAARLILVGTDPGITTFPAGVEVRGRIRDRAEIADLYRAADVLCVPSWFDPFPLVLLEAMGMGVPCVATRTGGVPEMLEHGVSGLVVEPGDVAGLAQCLLQVLQDKELGRRLGEAGRQRVLEEFTWDAVVDRMAPALQQAPEPSVLHRSEGK